MACRSARFFIITLAALMLLAGCQAAELTPTPSPEPSSSPASTHEVRLPIETELREAFQVTDPVARQTAVLAATRHFLQDESLRQADDQVASSYYTGIAFSSGRLTREDPVLIRRQRDQAVVALPEGMGLYLFSLNDDVPPVQISPWTAGLVELDVTWAGNELGVAYVTLGEDQHPRTHFALVVNRGEGWQSSWLSDEAPDWWFNAVDAALTAAPDLSRLVVTGLAERTTETFYESDTAPRRTFRLEWYRELNAYHLVVPPESFTHYQEWLWHTAEPSPYATLVEFIERIQWGRGDGLGELVSALSILEAASELRLDSVQRRFEVISSEPERIIFRDEEGTYLAVFSPPQTPGDPWLLASLEPVTEPEP